MPGMSRETANAILPSSITLTVVCVVATVVFVLIVFTRLGDRFPRIKNMSMMVGVSGVSPEFLRARTAKVSLIVSTHSTATTPSRQTPPTPHLPTPRGMSVNSKLCPTMTTDRRTRRTATPISPPKTPVSWRTANCPTFPSMRSGER